MFIFVFIFLKRPNKSAAQTIETFLHAVRDIGAEIEPAKAGEKVVAHCSGILDCEAAFFFDVDDRSNDLVLVGRSAKSIR